jgi:protease IV
MLYKPDILKKHPFLTIIRSFMKVNELLKSIILLLVLLMVLPSLIKNVGTQYAELIKEKTKIGQISFKKVLKDAQPYIDNLTTLFKDTSIKAIVLKMESGGGAAGTSQTIFNELKALKQKYPKPVIAFVENVCASGAYYIACAADSIIASPSSFIGSIGVYISQPELKDFIEQFKIKYSVIKTGTFKAVGDPFLELTPEQRTMLQTLTDSTYKQFVDDVATHRPKLSKNSSEWAEGKIFTGSQAEHLGLIDKVGSPAMVEQELRERVAIVGEIEWVKKGEPSYFEQYFSDLDADSFSSLMAEKIAYIIGQKTLQAQI